MAESLQDYEQAMEMIRKRSEEWKVFSDKVAVIGFFSGRAFGGSSGDNVRESS